MPDSLHGLKDSRNQGAKVIGRQSRAAKEPFDAFAAHGKPAQSAHIRTAPAHAGAVDTLSKFMLSRIVDADPAHSPRRYVPPSATASAIYASSRSTTSAIAFAWASADS